jgi:hypothetical protein
MKQKLILAILALLGCSFLYLAYLDSIQQTQFELFKIKTSTIKSAFTEAAAKSKNKIKHKYEYTKVDSLIKEPINFRQNSVQSDLTIVSAFFDINRKGRPNSDYFTWLNNTLKMNNPFVFFTQAKYKKAIIELISPNRPVIIIILEIEDTPHYADLDRVKRILDTSEYRTRMQDSGRIECTNPLYVMVQFSKFTMLDITARLDPFRSNRFLWMDAGASRFFKDYNLSIPLSGRNIPSNKFVINLVDWASSEEQFKNKDRGLLWSSNNLVRGTIMGGSSEIISNVSVEMGKEWETMLNESVVNNEQILLNLLLFRSPELFYVYDKNTKEWDFSRLLRFLV